MDELEDDPNIGLAELIHDYVSQANRLLGKLDSILKFMDRSNINSPNRKNLVIPLREVLSMTTGLVVDLYEENHELREENTKLKAKLAQLENKNF